MGAKIKSLAYYLPHTIEDNDVLKQDNPDWDIAKIFEKTGIKKRHISESTQTALDLAYNAAEKIFKNENTSKHNINALIFVTQSPDYILPTSACILQDKLGLNKDCMAFDMNLGCSGFVYALGLASSLINSNMATKVLVLCADTYTRYIKKNDRTCRPIFSDGGSAVIVEKSNQNNIGEFIFGTDGSGFDNLIIQNGGARNSFDYLCSPTLGMHGSKVFLFTMKEIPNVINKMLDKAKLDLDDLDLIVFHQASKFVIDNLIEKLSLDPKKVFINYEFIGNTVSASIPIALKDALDQNRLKNGDKIMLVGFGVGLSWAATVVNW